MNRPRAGDPSASKFLGQLEPQDAGEPYEWQSASAEVLGNIFHLESMCVGVSKIKISWNLRFMGKF